MDGGYRRERQVGLEQINPKPEPENVHQIDYEAESGEMQNGGGLVAVGDGGEQEECARSECEHIQRAERPADLKFRSDKLCERCRPDIKGQYYDCRTDKHQRETDGDAASSVPRKMRADIMSRHHISEITCEMGLCHEVTPKSWTGY